MRIWAVHLSDGVLQPTWIVAGFALTLMLVVGGSRRVRDEEIPRIALFTAVFFVGSLIHVRVGPTSVHLLLNGLLGVVLGCRAAIAILTGLLLQAVLLGHGGFTTIGVNCCAMVIPALLAGFIVRVGHQLDWKSHRHLRFLLVALTAAFFMGFVYYSVVALLDSYTPIATVLPRDFVGRVLVNPLAIACIIIAGPGLAWYELKWEQGPEFPLGVLIGQTTVIATVSLNSLILYFGGDERWETLARLLLLAHVPIAVVEGFILGALVSFVARARPSIFGWREAENSECTSNSVA